MSTSNAELFDVQVGGPQSGLAGVGAAGVSPSSERVAQPEGSLRPDLTPPIATSETGTRPLYRDPADVLMTFRLALVSLILVLVVTGLAAALVYKVTTAPPLIVVDRTREGDRVVFMDGQQIVDGVALTRDRPGDGDKRSAANLYAAFLYQIDPQTRQEDLEKAIKMMVPAVAVELMKQLRPDLEQQRRERWQTVWVPQVTSIDPADPYTVRVVGLQHITRVVKSEVKQESRQLTFNLKLVFDSRRRNENNQRTGFLIADLRDFHIINDPASSASSAGIPPTNIPPAAVKTP